MCLFGGYSTARAAPPAQRGARAAARSAAALIWEVASRPPWPNQAPSRRRRFALRTVLLSGADGGPQHGEPRGSWRGWLLTLLQNYPAPNTTRTPCAGAGAGAGGRRAHGRPFRVRRAGGALLNRETYQALN